MINLKMTRIVFLVLVISILVPFISFAEEDSSDLDIKVSEDNIPHSIANNEFYRESLLKSREANEAFEYGDYVVSAWLAEEAIRFARLSDEYIVNQLINEAERLIVLSETNSITPRFKNNFDAAIENYETAVEARSNEEWDIALMAALEAVEVLAVIEANRPGATVTTRPPSTTTGPTSSTTSTTSTRETYTVRTWRVERDCLWNIAGYSWVYGDSWRWRELYEANRSRMPNPDNPNLIHPGMVLDIPR
ncbi:MAG: LysM peptidoglycan-binding domain-containing protein [Treponema sp.]|nr:LysM peptidoglycan-binding domain-containing protein [Treponema sp.]